MRTRASTRALSSVGQLVTLGSFRLSSSPSCRHSVERLIPSASAMSWVRAPASTHRAISLRISSACQACGDLGSGCAVDRITELIAARPEV
jgi:hypothetical protein